MFEVTINRHFSAAEMERGRPSSASYTTHAPNRNVAAAVIRAAQIGYCGESFTSWTPADFRRLKEGCQMSCNDSASGMFITVHRIRQVL